MVKLQSNNISINITIYEEWGTIKHVPHVTHWGTYYHKKIESKDLDEIIYHDEMI